MQVRIKKGDQTLCFDSKECVIAILFRPADKEQIEKMAPEDLLFLQAPFQVMKDRAAEVWKWAMEGWPGARYVDRQAIIKEAHSTRKF